MNSLPPEPSEQEKRIANAAAAHTLATIFEDEAWPLLETWFVDHGELRGYVYSRADLATFARLLDSEIDTDIEAGQAKHWTEGARDDVKIRITYFGRDPAPEPEPQAKHRFIPADVDQISCKLCILPAARHPSEPKPPDPPAAPAPVASLLCEAGLEQRRGVICSRPRGHAGGHLDVRKGIYWPAAQPTAMAGAR
jgi:hypothetical protein